MLINLIESRPWKKQKNLYRSQIHPWTINYLAAVSQHSIVMFSFHWSTAGLQCWVSFRCTCFQLTVLWQRSKYLTWNPNYKISPPEAGWGSMSVSGPGGSGRVSKSLPLRPLPSPAPVAWLIRVDETLKTCKQLLTAFTSKWELEWRMGSLTSGYLRRDFADWHSVRLIPMHRVVLELSYT